MAFSLEKAVAARVVLLSGEEDALRLRALHELVAFATKDDDLDLQYLDGGDSEPMTWSACAGTAPFLSERRTVVVRHLLRQEEPNVAGWKELPDSALLILVADEEVGDDTRQRKWAAIRGQWEKAVKSAGGCIEDFKTDPKQLIESIRQEVTRIGKKMTPAAADALAEMCGGSLSRSLDELEKVVLYVGDRDQIGEADVRAAAMPSREWNVYRMTDAAISGDVPEALRQLRILVGSSTKAEDAAYSRIFPTMHRQMRIIWQARAIIDAKVNPEDPPESITRLFPDALQFSKQAPFVRTKALRSARNVDHHQIAQCMALISDADCRLKGILSGYSGMETLEQMLLSMASIVKR